MNRTASDWISRTCNPNTATDGLPDFSILLFLRDFGWLFWWTCDCSSNVTLVISKDPYVHTNRHSHHDVWSFKSAKIRRQRSKRRTMVQRMTRLSSQSFVRWRPLITHNVCFTASCDPINGHCSVSLLGGYRRTSRISTWGVSIAPYGSFLPQTHNPNSITRTSSPTQPGENNPPMDNTLAQSTASFQLTWRHSTP